MPAPIAPLWILNLSDPVLRADFETFYKAGSITEGEMAKALVGLVEEIGLKGAVSASQIADLNSIATHIGSMGASPYLQSITDALVYGDAANQYFTGGASSVALGELVAGSTSLVLAELTDKWFLGTDLPSDSATAGAPTYNISYVATDAPLYDSAAGPKMSDVNQGVMSGDCYFLAPLAEIAQQDPAMIESMIMPNGNGTDGVRFFNADGNPIYVTVADDLLPTSSSPGLFNNYSVGDWVNILEVAFTEAQEQGLLTGNTADDVWNSFTTIDNGGYDYYTLEAVTGARAIQEFVGDPSSSDWSVTDVRFGPWRPSSSTSTATEASVLSTLAADLLVGDDVEVGSTADAFDANGFYTLMAHHVFSIYGYDVTTGQFELRNPFGVQAGQTWDTTFEVSLDTLLQDGDLVLAADTGTATTVSGASVVAAAGLQAMAQVTSFSVTDSAASIEAGLSALEADTKLTAVTVTSPTGVNNLNLTGLTVAATVDMGADGGSATELDLIIGARRTPTLDLGSDYDSIALGSGPTTIDFKLGSGGGGVEDVTAFNAANDTLLLSLPQGGSVLQTFISGGDWVTSAADHAHGVFLAGVTTSQSVTYANSGQIATLA